MAALFADGAESGGDDEEEGRGGRVRGGRDALREPLLGGARSPPARRVSAQLLRGSPPGGHGVPPLPGREPGAAVAAAPRRAATPPGGGALSAALRAAAAGEDVGLPQSHAPSSVPRNSCSPTPSMRGLVPGAPRVLPLEPPSPQAQPSLLGGGAAGGAVGSAEEVAAAEAAADAAAFPGFRPLILPDPGREPAGPQAPRAPRSRSARARRGPRGV